MLLITENYPTIRNNKSHWPSDKCYYNPKKYRVFRTCKISPFRDIRGFSIRLPRSPEPETRIINCETETPTIYVQYLHAYYEVRDRWNSGKMCRENKFIFRVPVYRVTQKRLF